MTEYHPDTERQPDYIPAAGRDFLLPFYDLLTRVLAFDKAYNTLIPQIELADNLRVLEIGCGTGNVTTRIKRAAPGAEVVGIDPDPLALSRAQRKAHGMTGIRFQRAYAQALPFDDGEFDRVVSSMMLHHLDDDVKAQTAAEIHRVLRAGGSAHILDVGGEAAPQHGLAARFMKQRPHIASNMGDAIPRLFRSAGFECTELGTQRVRFINRVAFYRAVR